MSAARAEAVALRLRHAADTRSHALSARYEQDVRDEAADAMAELAELVAGLYRAREA